MSDPGSMVLHPRTLTHLERLEAESIQVMREVVAECEKPVMLYSIARTGGDAVSRAQGVLPGQAAVPLLHVDTKWKFARCTRSASAWSASTASI